MTIDEIIEELEESKDYPASDPASDEALDGAINIMHKYQKIAEIVTNNGLEWGNTSVRANALLEVKKVVEDGNDT